MKTRSYARQASAYLNELCDMLATQRTVRRPRRDWWNSPGMIPAALTLAAGASACGGTAVTNGDSPPTREICTDGVDNDGDGMIDCHDTECPPCASPVYSAPTDGGQPQHDAAKPDATSVDASPGKDAMQIDAVAEDGCAMSENCTNGVDDNCDGLRDCEDPDCAAHVCCQTQPAYAAPGPIELCHNGVDDDCDGLTDCLDDNCAASACCSNADYAAPVPPPEDCTAPDDEDCDGLINCDDPNCIDAGMCGGDLYAAPPQ